MTKKSIIQRSCAACGKLFPRVSVNDLQNQGVRVIEDEQTHQLIFVCPKEDEAHRNALGVKPYFVTGNEYKRGALHE